MQRWMRSQRPRAPGMDWESALCKVPPPSPAAGGFVLGWETWFLTCISLGEAFLGWFCSCVCTDTFIYSRSITAASAGPGHLEFLALVAHGCRGETRWVPMGFNVSTRWLPKGFLAKNPAMAGGPLACVCHAAITASSCPGGDGAAGKAPSRVPAPAPSPPSGWWGAIRDPAEG